MLKQAAHKIQLYLDLDLDSKAVFRAGLAIGGTLLISLLVWVNRDLIETYSYASYSMVLLLSVLTHLTVVFPAPTYAVALSMGLVLHPIWVGIIMGLGAGLGESLPYAMGRFGFSKEKIQNHLLLKLKNKAFMSVFVMAVLPNPLFDLAAIASGSLRVSYPIFVSATILGKSIRFCLLALISAKFLG